jgi:prepilin-type N-terminal cleavage/methylation domain-containing protein
MVTASRSQDRGMTLVEIMVTLIISSIIAASTFMFFAGQQRIYETQTKLLNIQQNLWAAMEVVARYTRASGGGMFECVRPASYSAAAMNGSRLQSSFPSPGPLSPSLADADRPATGVCASNPCGSGMQWIPPLWIVNNSKNEAALNVVTDTDILTVAFGNRTSGTDVDATLGLNFLATDDPISLTGTLTGAMFRQWEFILLLNPGWGFGTDPIVNPARGCTMFQISDNPATGIVLPHASVVGPEGIAWNPSGNVPAMLPLGGYIGNAAGVRNFGALTWVTFFIRRVGSGAPNLMMQQRHLGCASTSGGQPGDPQILAEGIEDLQVSFACDTGWLTAHNLALPNGQLDEGTDDATRRLDEWWNNVPNDVLPLPNTDGFCNLPTAIRLTLVARTLTPDDMIDAVATGNGPLDVEDHRYSSPRPTDQFRRRVLTTTVFPRNNKPL